MRLHHCCFGCIICIVCSLFGSKEISTLRNFTAAITISHVCMCLARFFSMKIMSNHLEETSEKLTRKKRKLFSSLFGWSASCIATPRQSDFLWDFLESIGEWYDVTIGVLVRSMLLPFNRRCKLRKARCKLRKGWCKLRKEQRRGRCHQDSSTEAWQGRPSQGRRNEKGE